MTPGEIAARLKELVRDIEGRDGYGPVMKPLPTFPEVEGGNPLAEFLGADPANMAVARHKFDLYLYDTGDYRKSRTVELISPEWFPEVIKQYGSLETWITAAMESQRRSREDIGRWVRSVFLDARAPVPAWWAQYWATSPA